MVIVGLDHVQVGAPAGAEDEARCFYGELLGLPELPKPPELAGRGGAWFQCGAQQLHVGVDEPFVAARKAHPGIAVATSDDLEALAERLAEAGVDVRWDTVVPDVHRFHTDDPWGNRLEFVALAT